MRGPRVAVWALAGIVGVALLLRVVLALAAPFPHIGGDPAVYDEIGVALASGDGFARLPRRAGRHARPTAMHPPAWPVLLGLAYAATGHGTRLDRASATGRGGPAAQARATGRWRVGRMLQVALEASGIGLLGTVAWQLWGPALGLIAAAIAAVYPPPAILALALHSEPLFVVLELAAVAAVLRARSGRTVRWALVAGVLAGLATLTRNNGLVLVLPLAVAVWKIRPGRSLRDLGTPLAVAGTALLVLAPWTIRNEVALGAFVPVASNLGLTLAGTYNPQAERHYYRWRSPRLLPPARRRELRTMSEPERSASLARDGLDYIRAHPTAPVVASAENTARVLELDPEGRSVLRVVVGSRTLALIAVGCFWAFVPLALAGALTRRARQAPWWFWLTPVLLWASVVPFAVGFSRFRVPLEPWLILLGACAIAAPWRTRLD
jgi:4-amino-4-deoxy-L-arabinose transferase-like glycosyltransferase